MVNDVIKWKHFLCYWPFVQGIYGSPVNSHDKVQWRRALMFTLICIWTNVWVNNRDAGNLKRYRTHYDVTVMRKLQPHVSGSVQWINTLKLRQNSHHFPDNIFKFIFLNENIWILLKISLKFVNKVPIKNIPALVQIMVWRRPGDKPLSEPMIVSLLMHICVPRP